MRMRSTSSVSSAPDCPIYSVCGRPTPALAALKLTSSASPPSSPSSSSAAAAVASVPGRVLAEYSVFDSVSGKQRQYLYFCASKASKVSACMGRALWQQQRKQTV